MVSVRTIMIAASIVIGSVTFLPMLPNITTLFLFILPLFSVFFIPLFRCWLALLIPLLFAFLWAAGYGYLNKDQQLPAALEGTDIWVEGEVVGLPKRSFRAQKFELKVLSLTSDKGAVINSSLQRIRVKWYRKWDKKSPTLSINPNIQPGEHWRLLLRLKRGHGFANPGGFDYEGWLFKQGIGATGYVRQHQDNQQLNPIRPKQLLGQWRYTLLQSLSQRLDDNSHKGLLLALLMGETTEIKTDQRQLLSATGTNHLFVISGLHVGFVALCAYGLFFNISRCLLFGPPRVAAQQIGICGALLAACLYAAVAGFSLPTQRALIMLVVMLIGRLLRRKIDVWYRYSVALLLVLLWDPLAPSSAGFWLSFGAVGGLLYAFNSWTHSGGLWWFWGRPQWVFFYYFFPRITLFFPASIVNITAR